MYTKNCEITYDNWRKSMLEAKKNCEENDVAPAEAFHQFSLLFNAKRKLFEFVNILVFEFKCNFSLFKKFFISDKQYFK